MKPVVLYGSNVVAKQVYLESKRNGSNFHVEAFCVSDNFLNGETSFCGLPLIAESEIAQKYPPEKYDMLSCVDAPSKLRNRLLVYDRLKGMGYFLRNFISPLAHIYEQVQMGENNIIFAFAQLIYNIQLGHSNIIYNNVVLVHDIAIGNGSHLSIGTVIGGSVEIGDSCWLGLNCAISNNLAIANDTLVASGAVIMSDTKQGFTYIGNPAKACFSHKDTGIMMNLARNRKVNLQMR